MSEEFLHSFLNRLNTRRKALNMPLEVLVRRSGVPRATVYRLLKGDHKEVGLLKLAAVASALGVEVKLDCRETDVEEVLAKQAKKQATRLVGMVQSTMALDAQALKEEQVRKMTDKTSRELLVEPKKKLWYE